MNLKTKFRVTLIVMPMYFIELLCFKTVNKFYLS